MTQLGFYLDASACTGCKACQAACKDKHGLTLGSLYRRVYEVTGGGWTRAGEAWVSDVFAYNLSLACQHCEQPICVEICPARAYSKRADGIVLLDSTRCMGCQYCVWACPYEAPQYDPHAGITGKCTFCVDELDAGRSPVCVAACPLRALEFGELEKLRARHASADSVYPLPDPVLTAPALVITPHRAAASANEKTARIGNREEVAERTGHETPLVIFTILAQLAVGAFWTLSVLAAWLSSARLNGRGDTLNPAWAVIALVMISAILASFAHLGRPLRSWRAFSNHSSPLSWEILCATLFAISTVLFAAVQSLVPERTVVIELIGGLTALVGLALVTSMVRVYRLRTIPVWNRLTTPASFLATTLLLGGLGGWTLFMLSSGAIGKGMEWTRWAIPGLTMLLVATQLFTRHQWVTGSSRARMTFESARRGERCHSWMIRLGWGFALAGVLAALSMALVPSGLALVLAFVFVFSSEILGRSLFYAARRQNGI